MTTLLFRRLIRSMDPRRLTKRQTRGEDVAVSLSHKKSKKLVRAVNCVATQDEVLQNSVASKQASGASPSWCVNVGETNVRETDGFDNVVREDHRPLLRQANASVEQRIKARFHVILEHLSNSEICQPEMSGLPALVVKEVLHVCRIGGCAVGYRDLDSGRPYLKPMVIVT